MTYEPAEDDDGSDTANLVKTVKYEPQELDKEEEAFADALDYLNTTFTFERSQLPLFLKSLRDKVSGALKEVDEGNDQQDGDDDEVEMVEG